MQQISRTMPDKQRRKYDCLLTIRQKKAIANIAKIIISFFDILFFIFIKNPFLSLFALKAYIVMKIFLSNYSLFT